jgi:hypothetical protein
VHHSSQDLDWPSATPLHPVNDMLQRAYRHYRCTRSPDAPTSGLAVDKLALGTVRVRSDVDGALEADRIMESSPAFAACGPKGRKSHDIRGYWAEWMVNAKGGVFRVSVKPFAGKDPADDVAADCLRKALEATPLPCPRDGNPVKVTTAICL